MALHNRLLTILLACVAFSSIACEGKRRSEWDTLDYSGVYQRNRGYENDSGYRQPTVLGCVDDDLYNCR